jgi:hypothetical protein
MRILILQFIFVPIVALSCNTTPKNTNRIDVDIDIIKPQNYIVCKTNTPITIDGIGNEQAWKDVPFTNSFTDIEGVKTPKYDTKVKMLWDKKYFYVYAQMSEPHVWGNLHQRDTIVYYNNDIELFMDPSMDTYNYGEIEINALNTVWDLKLDKPYRTSGNADNSWDLDSLKSAIKIYGTLNNPNDTDSCWSIEIAIPIERAMELKNNKGKIPSEGEQWKVNFLRVEWDYDLIDGNYDRKKEDGKYLPEYNWAWSSQGEVNMHQPEKWGIIQFTNKQKNNSIKFIEDKDFIYKQTAYALFRKTLEGELKDLLENKTGFTKNITAKSDTETINNVFTKTPDGFQYQVFGQKKSYIINQNGYLKIVR